MRLRFSDTIRIPRGLLLPLALCSLLPGPSAQASPSAEHGAHEHASGAASHEAAPHGATSTAHGDTAHGAPSGGAPSINWTDFAARHTGGSAPLIASVINFALLLYLLIRFTRKPLTGYLAGRHQQIRDDLAEAARLRKEAEQHLAAVDAKLNGLDDEISEIKSTVAKDAERERERIIAAAQHDAAQILETADRALAVEIDRAKRRLEVTATQAALSAAETLLRAEMKPEDHQRLRDEYFQQIEQARGGN